MTEWDGGGHTPGEVMDIVDRVMRDCDIDGNNRLSYTEFAKVITRVPDFTTKFSLRTISCSSGPRK